MVAEAVPHLVEEGVLAAPCEGRHPVDNVHWPVEWRRKERGRIGRVEAADRQRLVDGPRWHALAAEASRHRVLVHVDERPDTVRRQEIHRRRHFIQV
eukprot:108902-Prymnesium_polylepis.2